MKSNTSKFRSPYRDIDLSLLRLLAGLHPWPLRELCHHVGMDRSVLTNVFSGQRPLPTRVAPGFLGLIGMRPDGTLDPSFGFVFVEHPAKSEELIELLARIFPKGAGVGAVRLSIKHETQTEGIRGEFETGIALYDGRFAVVVQGESSATASFASPESTVQMHDFDTPHVLLSADPLPTKYDIVKAFAGGKFAVQASWDDVRSACDLKGLSPQDVLQMVRDYPKSMLGK